MGKGRPRQDTASLHLWLRVYWEAYGSGRAPNPHVVPTSLTWRNPPSNPPGSYLSGGGPRRRRRAAAGAAGAAQAAAGIPRAASWDGVGDPDRGRPEPRFSPRGGKACERGGLPGDVPPAAALRSPRSGARAGLPSLPECAPGPGAVADARGKLGPGRPATARHPEAPGRRVGGGPAGPACRGRKRRTRGAELPSSPARGSEESAPPPRSPRQDRCPGGGGRAARPRNLRRVTLGGCRFPYGGGRRACVRAEPGVPGCRCPLGGSGLRPGTRDARGEGPWAPGRPRPRRGLSGTLPARRWPPLRATSSLPVLPPGLPPGLGAGTGGRGWTRRARRLQARAGERGAAGSRGRPGACGPAERGSVGQPRGAPLPGVGRLGDRAGGIRAPRRRAGRAGRGDRLVRMAGRSEPPWEGPVTPHGKRGPGLCPPAVPGAGPREPGGLRASRETWLGRRAAPLAGRLPRVSGWVWRFFRISAHARRSQTKEALAFFFF